MDMEKDDAAIGPDVGPLVADFIVIATFLGRPSVLSISDSMLASIVLLVETEGPPGELGIGKLNDIFTTESIVTTFPEILVTLLSMVVVAPLLGPENP